MFLSNSSLLMVLGGTLAATMIAYRSRYVYKTLIALFSIVLPFSTRVKEIFMDMQKLIDFSRILKQDGLIAVE